MKKYTLMVAVVAVTHLTSNLSFGSCLTKEELVTSREAVSLGSCSITKTPRLLQGQFHYHHMKHNPYLVSYWAGEYSRSVTIRETVLRDIIDSCATDLNGDPIRTILEQKTITRDKAVQKSFEIDNPNLDPNLSASYTLVPMTSDEVKNQMEALRSQCENFTFTKANTEIKGSL